MCLNWSDLAYEGLITFVFLKVFIYKQGEEAVFVKMY